MLPRLGREAVSLFCYTAICQKWPMILHRSLLRAAPQWLNHFPLQAAATLRTSAFNVRILWGARSSQTQNLRICMHSPLSTPPYETSLWERMRGEWEGWRCSSFCVVSFLTLKWLVYSLACSVWQGCVLRGWRNPQELLSCEAWSRDFHDLNHLTILLCHLKNLLYCACYS